MRVSAVTTAQSAWGVDAPAWVLALAGRVDALGSQRAAAAEIGYSAAAVNLVLAGKYRGALDNIAAQVRGSIMSAAVICPVLGEITKERCEQERTRPFAAASAMRVQLWRECKRCQYNNNGGLNDA
ncbi:MAG: hypothetical protein PWQ57_879 [Desulfovibrionales bacterium]|nr:hypothetical protein [Desulfovibrionales bacterium]